MPLTNHLSLARWAHEWAVIAQIQVSKRCSQLRPDGAEEADHPAWLKQFNDPA